MSGEKPASDHLSATPMERGAARQHTSQPDEEPARKGARVVLDSGETSCGYTPKKSTESEDGHHACTLSKESERNHYIVLARSRLRS